MHRSKSKSSLQIPDNAFEFRSYHILQQGLRSKDTPTVKEEERPEKSHIPASLNDSMLFSPEKPPLPQTLELETVHENDDATGDKTTSVESDPLKAAYAAAVQDLRKGFPAVCNLVSLALDKVTAPDDNNEDAASNVTSYLSNHRFWVDCGMLNQRYPMIAADQLQPEGEDMKSPDEWAKERAANRAKRIRRFHFQIILRIALYKTLCERNLQTGAKLRGSVLHDIVRMIQALTVGEKLGFAWQFLEQDIQFRCGNSEFVRQLITDVCDELLIPLPDYSHRPGAKTPMKLPPMSPGATSVVPIKAIQSLRPHASFGSRRTASQAHLKPMDTKGSFAAGQNSFTSQHRFARQRSSIEFGGSQSRGRPPPIITQKSVPLAGIHKDDTITSVRRTLSFVSERKGEKRSSTEAIDQGISCELKIYETPKRPSETCSRGTPLKDRLLAARTGKSPGVGAMKYLTEASPFKRLSAKKTEGDIPQHPPSVVREGSHRRQLQF